MALVFAAISGGVVHAHKLPPIFWNWKCPVMLLSATGIFHRSAVKVASTKNRFGRLNFQDSSRFRFTACLHRAAGR
jgi:hypothetical protein